MTGIISTPPAPASPEGAVVQADGWWPDVDVNALRIGLRIGGTTITHERLTLAIEGAIIAAISETDGWRAARIAEGLTALDMIDIDPATDAPREIGGRPRSHHLWERLVRFHAMAELADTHPDLTATDKAQPRDEAVRNTADDYRRMAVAAARDLISLGAPRATRVAVELL